MRETFKRKTVVIKEYLMRYGQVEDILPKLKIFTILTSGIVVVLRIYFNDGRYILCTYHLNHFLLGCFNKDKKRVYKYCENTLPVFEEILIEDEMQMSKEYIDFGKFLKDEALVKPLFEYLSFHTSKKSFQK